MVEPANHNLSIWWAIDDEATDISDRLPDGVSVTPIPTTEEALVVGGNVPRRTVLGLTYSIAVPRAYWDKDIDGIFSLNADDGWLVIYDDTADVALVTPAQLTVRPRGGMVADPAATMRTSLLFGPPEDDRRPWHVAPGLSGTKRIIVDKGSGISFTDVSSAATSITVASDGDTVTLVAVGGA